MNSHLASVLLHPAKPPTRLTSRPCSCISSGDGAGATFSPSESSSSLQQQHGTMRIRKEEKIGGGGDGLPNPQQRTYWR